MYSSTRQQCGIPLLGRAIGRVGEVVFHTEAGARMPVGSTLAQERQRMYAIHRFHQSLGWSGFAYSAGGNPRSRAGRVHEGRGYGRSGAHTQGRNSSSLAFVFFGHGDYDAATEELWRGVRNWIGRGIREGMLVPNPKISGHRNYAQKSCPGNKIYPQIYKARGVTGPEKEPLSPPPDPWEEFWMSLDASTREFLQDMASQAKKEGLAGDSFVRQFMIQHRQYNSHLRNFVDGMLEMNTSPKSLGAVLVALVRRLRGEGKRLDPEFFKENRNYSREEIEALDRGDV